MSNEKLNELRRVRAQKLIDLRKNIGMLGMGFFGIIFVAGILGIGTNFIFWIFDSVIPWFVWLFKNDFSNENMLLWIGLFIMGLFSYMYSYYELYKKAKDAIN